jgi:hypothetical protein
MGNVARCHNHTRIIAKCLDRLCRQNHIPIQSLRMHRRLSHLSDNRPASVTASNGIKQIPGFCLFCRVFRLIPTVEQGNNFGIAGLCYQPIAFSDFQRIRKPIAYN